MRQSRGRRAIRWVAARRWWVTAGFVVVAAGLVIGARSGDEDATSGQYAIAVLLGLIALLVALNLLFRLAGVDADAAEIAERLAVRSDQQLLLTRWLERARWARFVGGLSGVLAWLLGAQADGGVFVWGFAGIAAGGVAAELHQLRRPPGPRTARLEVRSVGNYLWPFGAWHMVGTAALGAATAVFALAVGDRRAAALAAGAALTIGVGHLVQRRVASRPRPALPDSLRSADDLVRELAIDRNIAWPCTYFALSLIATAAWRLDELPAGVQFLGVAVQFYAIGLWWRNRRVGLDHLLHGHPQPVLA